MQPFRQNIKLYMFDGLTETCLDSSQSGLTGLSERWGRLGGGFGVQLVARACLIVSLHMTCGTITETSASTATQLHSPSTMRV